MIIFFGPAGSGKSLQGQILAAREGWPWLSTGQMLRESKDEELGLIMKSGKLVPNEKMNQIVADSLKGYSDAKTIILDGFPREIGQASWMIENDLLHGDSADTIIVVDVPADMLVKRMQGRGRADDTPEAIAERLKAYDELTTPVIEYFENQGITVIRVDGSGKVGEIHDGIMEELVKCKLV